MWKYYTAYGLSIRSAVILPELQDHPSCSSGSSVGNWDVTIRLAPAEDSAPTTTDVVQSIIDDHSARLIWPNLGQIVIRSGNDICVSPQAGADPDAIRMIIIGPAIATLLHQRGFPAIHSSAVAIGNSSCLFLGNSGWGKSTMCAAMSVRGHEVLSDDVSIVQYDANDQPILASAFPRLKMMPDSAMALGINPETLRSLLDGAVKRSYVPDNFSNQAIALKHIYVLAKGDDLRIDSLSPSDGLIQLVTHTYTISMLKAVNRAHHFRQYARLASSVPIKQLTRPWDLSRLDEVIDVVEADMAAPALV